MGEKTAVFAEAISFQDFTPGAGLISAFWRGGGVLQHTQWNFFSEPFITAEMNHPDASKVAHKMGLKSPFSFLPKTYTSVVSGYSGLLKPCMTDSWPVSDVQC